MSATTGKRALRALCGLLILLATGCATGPAGGGPAAAPPVPAPAPASAPTSNPTSVPTTSHASLSSGWRAFPSPKVGNAGWLPAAGPTVAA